MTATIDITYVVYILAVFVVLGLVISLLDWWLGKNKDNSK